MKSNHFTATTLEKQIIARLDKAIWEYKMLAAGDKILICVSGGADSMLLLRLLSKRYTIFASDLQLFALYVEMGFADNAEQRCEIMQNYFTLLQINGTIIKTDIGPYSHSPQNLENPCFLCSRIRRKHIFATAEKLHCNKIVFAHHKDDIVETLLLNMIFGREISTMTPVLPVHQGKYVIIRPMVFMEESLIKQLAGTLAVPVFDQQCPSSGNSKRQYIKELINKIDQDFYGSRDNIFNSMKRVKKDYLL